MLDRSVQKGSILANPGWMGINYSRRLKRATKKERGKKGGAPRRDGYFFTLR